MALMTDQVKTEVSQFLKKLEQPVTAHFYGKSGDPASDAMGQLLEELAGLNPLIQVDQQSLTLSPLAPETVGDLESSVTILSEPGQTSGIRYLGFPGGHEFSTFLDDLVTLSTHAPSTLDKEALAYVQSLSQPVHLQVFVTPTWPYCPRAVRLAHEMARANPKFVVADMVDAQSFGALSSRFGVMSVPLTVVNGTEKLVGAVPEGQLLQSIRSALS